MEQAGFQMSRKLQFRGLLYKQYSVPYRLIVSIFNMSIMWPELHFKLRRQGDGYGYGARERPTIDPDSPVTSDIVRFFVVTFLTLIDESETTVPSEELMVKLLEPISIPHTIS